MPDERPLKHRQDVERRKHEHDRKKKKSKHHKSSDEEIYTIKGNSKNRDPSEVIEIHDSSSADEGEIVSEDQNSDVPNSPKVTHRHRHKHSRHHSRKHKKSHDVDRYLNEDKDSRSHRSDLKKRHARELEHRVDDSLKKSRRERDRGVEIKQDLDDEDDKRVNRHKSREGRMHSPTRIKREEIDEEAKDEDDSRRKRDRSRGRSRNNDDNQRNIKREDNRENSSQRNENPRPGRNRQRFNEDTNEYEWGKNKNPEPSVKTEPTEKAKPDFKLSGKLTEDRNTFNGVVIKYSEPPEARMPKKRWRLYQFKGQETLPTLYIHRQSAYLIGRDRKVVDLPVDHPSCSKQHAALQYRLITFERPNGSIGKQIRLYVIDLESANGTFINGDKIDSKKYVELMERDVIKFGFSSREYVLLHEQSKDDESDEG